MDGYILHYFRLGRNTYGKGHQAKHWKSEFHIEYGKKNNNGKLREKVREQFKERWLNKKSDRCIRRICFHPKEVLAEAS